VRNEIRYRTESLLSGVFGRPSVERPKRMLGSRNERREATVAMGDEREFEAVRAELAYEPARDMYEMRIAATTPDWFWCCRSCGRKGHVFNDAASLLEPRELLARLEDAMKPTWDSQVYNPVNRNGLRRREDD
jgi:hypothetical protein